MCGIVGYIGNKSAVPILVEGLKKLEYRGYDSAGVAVIEQDKLSVQKSVGRLVALEEKLAQSTPEGTIGIGHTRWATHGKPSDENSHPHTDCTGDFAVVHNGIIENYLELREWLQSKGHVFTSETDSETLAHLLEEFYDGDLTSTLRQVIAKVEGSYATVVITDKEPGKLVAARKDSPLVVGLGDGEYFLASDIPAILEHTRDTLIIDDGEVVTMTRSGVSITDCNGSPVMKEIFKVEWDAVAAEKGGYEHFMLKEIHEQPKAVRETLSGRLDPDNKSVILHELKMSAAEIKNIRKVFIVACGTAYHAGLVGKCVIEDLARIPVEVDIASEFRYRDPLIGPGDLMIVVSQSGETADTLAAMREGKKRGAHILAVTNVVGSTVSREAADVIYTWAGPEIAVASTKAYTTQLVAMFLIGLHLAQTKATVPQEEITKIITSLRNLPDLIQQILDDVSAIEKTAAHCAKFDDTFFIGRGLDYAVAMEGSLKLKEISYIHAEAYAAGELKHGTLALIIDQIPVIALATQMNLYDKTVSNIKEVKARDAHVLAIAMEGNKEIAKVVDDVLFIPQAHQVIMPALAVVPLQLLAYYASVARGNDVDKPRNLAKSVTVE